MSSGPTRPGGSLYFLLGDVSGKGVAASLLMSNLHATIRSLSSVGLTVEELLTRANRLFCQHTLDTHYATLVCGRSIAPGVIELSNAGHWPVAHVRPDQTRFIDSSGLALGMFCGSEYRHQQLRLDPGDFLVLYTDGLTEAQNRAGEEYGTDRLAAHLAGLARQPGLTARDLTTACVRDLAAFRGGAPANDDLTIMIVRRTAVSALGPVGPNRGGFNPARPCYNSRSVFWPCCFPLIWPPAPAGGPMRRRTPDENSLTLGAPCHRSSHHTLMRASRPAWPRSCSRS